MPKRVYTGLEYFVANYAHRYKGKNVALATNQTGVDSNLQKNFDLLRDKGLEIVLILAPEHGLYGYQNNYENRLYNDDERLNLIIYNLHHLNTKSLRHLLKTIDIVIFDIQDLGMRCYTYISSLKFLMDALEGSNKKLLVFDRPNPLGFLGTDGANLDQRYYSRHVSAFPAPLIYNFTIGEAAIYYKWGFYKNLNLKVYRLINYRRSMLFNETTLPWIPPSPNLPTYKSSIIYSMLVLLEGVNISLGRGTVKPFEYIGAPWIEPVSFCNGLRDLKFRNFTFMPIYFLPLFSKYKDEKCGGAQIFYKGGRFIPTKISYMLIKYLKEEYDDFEWKEHNGSYKIDYLAGTDRFRRSIENGRNYKNYNNKIKRDIKQYNKERKKYLIYNQ